MSSERVLVRGYAGNVGSHIVDLAVQGSADEVIVLDNFGRGRYENLMWTLDTGPVQVVEGDLCERVLVAAPSASVYGAAVEAPTRGAHRADAAAPRRRHPHASRCHGDICGGVV
jgi:nucleoside-diphosphate-sugar epimerase